MDASEREGIKEQLRAMVAGRGDGIDLDSPDRWVIEGLTDPTNFFRHLGLLLPIDSILYFEGSDIHAEAGQFYQQHRAANAVSVVRDSIFPVPEIFHVELSAPVLEGIVDLLQRHSVEACFHHVKAYRKEKLLFTFHDAFDGSDIHVSDQIPEQNIADFSARFGAKYLREPNVNKRDPEQLRLFLLALEHPEKVRINWPWWKKALYFWKR